MTGEHRVAYASYMRSAAWDGRRRAALIAADYQCERCGAEDEELQVHHLTYARLGRELPSDLKVVCIDCHALEDREREQRVAYDEAFRRWAAEQFGPDWRWIGQTGYVEQQFALYIELLNLDASDLAPAVERDTPGDAFHLDGSSALPPHCCSCERSPYTDPRKVARVREMADLLIARCR